VLCCLPVLLRQAIRAYCQLQHNACSSILHALSCSNILPQPCVGLPVSVVVVCLAWPFGGCLGGAAHESIWQVESRMQALNSAYDAAATISHHLTQVSSYPRGAASTVVGCVNPLQGEHNLTRMAREQESLMAKNAGGRVHNPNFPGMYMSKTTTQTTTAHYRPGSVEPVAFEASTTTRFRASSIEPVS